MTPPLLAIVDIQRKADGRMYHVWLPLFLIWLLLLPLAIIALPFVIIIGLIVGIQIFAALGGLMRVLNSLNGTEVEIDQTRRHITIHLV
ncbi:MAG: hypothetical protein GC190_21550 [Alphaproteobacteria bacterium]|nr:hypothetical protein [Alphaproteobacteria bacterium]